MSGRFWKACPARPTVGVNKKSPNSWMLSGPRRSSPSRGSAVGRPHPRARADRFQVRSEAARSPAPSRRSIWGGRPRRWTGTGQGDRDGPARRSWELRATGRMTCAFLKPASPGSCRICVLTGGSLPACVKPAAPTHALKAGENGSEAQFTDVYVACSGDLLIRVCVRGCREPEGLGPARGRVSHEPLTAHGPIQVDVDRSDVDWNAQRLAGGVGNVRDVAQHGAEPEVALAELDVGHLDDLLQQRQRVRADRPQHDPEARRLAGGGLDVVERAVHRQRHGQGQRIEQVRVGVRGHRAHLAGGRAAVGLKLGEACTGASPWDRPPGPAAGRPSSP